MKFYIASKFQNHRAVAEAIYKMQTAGHTVTHDWTKEELFNTSEALRCVEGVRECDVFIGLFQDKYDYKGSLSELGMAIITARDIWIIGNQIDSVIFTCLPSIKRVGSVWDIIDYYRGQK